MTPEPEPTPPLPRVQWLLVVAGPTGAGKSTFLKAMASGTLPRDVAALIPAAAQRWHVLSKRAHEQQSMIAEWARSGATPRIVQEYTLNGASGPNDFPSDPRLALVRTADQVTIVTLRVSPQRLSEHLHYYYRRKLDNEESKFWHWLRLYAQPGRVEEIYASWLNYVTTMAAQGVPIDRIELRPAEENPAGAEFGWCATGD